MAEEKIKHVLGLSGGKDSSALAVYMADNYPDLEIEYFLLILAKNYLRSMNISTTWRKTTKNN